MQANTGSLAEGTASQDRRSGVAIIVVLGVVALLMLLGVAFSITMRVERTGAGNFAQQVATRQLIGATVAAAMQAVDASMASGTTNYLYPRWAMLPSPGSGDSARLAWGRALDYIPASLVPASQDAGESWMALGASEGGIEGYGSFLVINESGMVDANRAAGLPRTAGTNAQELIVQHFNAVQDAEALVSTRADDVRYETLAEFNALQDGQGLDGPSDYFSVYSRAPRGALQDNQPIFTNQVYLGDHWTNWEVPARRAAITSALSQASASFQPLDPLFVYNALLDYADEDSVPRDLENVATEAVPLINELKVAGAIVPAGASWQAAGQVRMEFAYVWAEPSPYSYTVMGTVDTVVQRQTGGDPAYEEMFRWTDSFSQPTTYATNVDHHDNTPYRHIELAFDGQPWVGPHDFTGDTNDVVRLRFEVQAFVLVDQAQPNDSYPAGTVVNQVTNSNFSVETAAVRLGDIVGTWTHTPPSKEALDPRYNWHANAWFPHPEGDGEDSLSEQNAFTTTLIGPAFRYAQGVDWDLKRHVSNAGRLTSPAELGYLPRRGGNADLALRSIRLIEFRDGPDGPARPHDRVLDFFTCDLDDVAAGRVSLNTLHQPVLWSIFRGIPIDYPDSDRPLDAPPSTANADALALAILSWRTDPDDPNVFRNVSDIGTLDWRSIPGYATRSDHEIESVIAHTSELVTTRQNLFTVLVAARTFRMGLGVVADAARAGTFLADERALVQLWRDPFPTTVQNPDGSERDVHEWRVEYFRWLGAE